MNDPPISLVRLQRPALCEVDEDFISSPPLTPMDIENGTVPETLTEKLTSVFNSVLRDAETSGGRLRGVDVYYYLREVGLNLTTLDGHQLSIEHLEDGIRFFGEDAR
jgi:hypothetical protein